MKKLSLVVVAVGLGLVACTKHSPLEDCKKDPAKCSAVDIEDSEAKVSYQAGCDAKDSESCYRLGQFLEIKAENMGDALKAYEQSCSFKNNDGCEDAKDLRSKLCYIDKKPEFCKGEPEGEYRIYVFLEKLDPKYQDAFLEHDFSSGFGNDEVEDLYVSRLNEKNKKLLTALKLSKDKGHHDGDDAETLQRDIDTLEGKHTDAEEK